VNGKSLPAATHILHLADRVDVLSMKKEPFDSRIAEIVDNIRAQRGKMFSPDAADAFVSAAAKEAFWFDIADGGMIGGEEEDCRCVALDAERLLELAGLICHIIDFRSRFTATHSSGVAAVTRALAARFGFSERECAMMSVAGLLHDLGKLAVPREIIDKPAALTGSEFGIMKKHPYLTFRALAAIEHLREINEWASFHHERMDGSGYPFHVSGRGLSLGSRIVAAADNFVALTEDRPYREAMELDDALKLLARMSRESALDPEVISVLSADIDEVNDLKEGAQRARKKNTKISSGKAPKVT
jgi:HD-GYP domain-containing protein (c-di-GMP phosphodiesterase class II)